MIIRKETERVWQGLWVEVTGDRLGLMAYQTGTWKSSYILSPKNQLWLDFIYISFESKGAMLGAFGDNEAEINLH